MKRQCKKRGAKIYALYKGDQFLDIGTSEYLGKLLNVNPRTIEFYSMPSYIKRAKLKYDNRLIATPIGFEKDNLEV